MDVKLTSALLQGSWIKFNLKPKTVDAIAGVMVPWVKTKVCPVRKMAPPVLVDVAWPQSSSATSQRMPPLKKWQIISDEFESQAKLGHSNFWAETELTICTARTVNDAPAACIVFPNFWLA